MTGSSLPVVGAEILTRRPSPRPGASSTTGFTETMGAGAVMATSVAATSDAVMGKSSFAFPMGKLSNKLVTVAPFALAEGVSRREIR